MEQEDVRNLTLDSREIGALPLINHFLDRLGLHGLLAHALPEHKNRKLQHAEAILLFVRNILIERTPLYKVAEWVRRFDQALVGLTDAPPAALNDDRVGRSLDALFDADRASLLTTIVMRAIDRFDIDVSQLHNDSTTVTVYGEYAAQQSQRKHKRSIALTYGHNKDHRPDLKQLLFTLTVSRDGAVPIHYKSYDGNTTDNTTHIHTWETLRRITGRNDFIYVADSKLCTRAQMDHITQEGGRFISILPENRKECSWFKKWFRTHSIQWREILRRPDHRKPESAEHIYWGYESPMPSREGYRIIWILSSQKQEQDAKNRQRRIEKTISALDALKQKVGTGKWKSKDRIEESVKAILQKHQSENWFEWKMIGDRKETYKQKGRGRPGKNTEYIKVSKETWSFEAMPSTARILHDGETDGLFPLITNIEAKDLSMAEVLRKYKFQPYIEKRHQQLKSVFDAAPVFLKRSHRIEALMFVYFLVLLVNALIERELRLAMRRNNIRFLPLYPEKRKCRHPATARILALFSNQRKHILTQGGQTLRVFYDSLSRLQKTVLNLLNVSTDVYGC